MNSNIPASSENLFQSLKVGTNVSTTEVVTDLSSAPTSTVENTTNEEAPAPQPNELEMLKARARTMGITFSNNIGIDSLKARINAKLTGEADPGEQQEAQQQPVQQAPVAMVYSAPVQVQRELTPAEKAQKLRDDMYAEQMKLVRLRITNLNPNKKDLPGEIITVANKILGSVKKYVPFGELTEQGYHVPYCIYTELRDREFVNIRTRKSTHGGTPVIETSMAREFALEVLPMLTDEEIARLASAQAAAGND